MHEVEKEPPILVSDTRPFTHHLKLRPPKTPIVRNTRAQETTDAQ